MVHHNNCPLCSSQVTALYLSTADHFLSREKFDLCQCISCGFIFTQDHPDEKEAGHYYESDEYLSHNTDKKDLISSIYRIFRSLMLIRKTGIVRKTTGIKKGKILDIGSGAGYFLNAMKNAGWDCKGIEINEKARVSSVSKFELDVLDPSQIGNLLPGTFDCISLWHVLEHFHNLFGYASEINRLLKPGGTCIIALPNSSSYDAEYYGPYWAAWDVPRHLWHFSPETFRNFSERTGFKLMSVRSLPPDVFYIAAMSEKYKGTKLFYIPGFLKGLWFSLLSLFNKDSSSSLIYLLRKPLSS